MWQLPTGRGTPLEDKEKHAIISYNRDMHVNIILNWKCLSRTNQ